MARRRNKMRLSEDRDVPMLKYLWKWKVASTQVLHAAFFGDTKTRYSYQRLLKLRRFGFVELTSDRNARSSFWTLGKKGYLAIKDDLPELIEDGFRSENIRHDFLASVIQQGPFIYGKAKGVGILSEQQLRRLDPEFLHPLVRDTKLHRPDGYWLLQDGDEVTKIAFELELSQKSTSKIDRTAGFYATFCEPSKVIWVIDGKGLLSKTKERMELAKPDSQIHYYFQLKDILKLGWQAENIGRPEHPTTIQNLISYNGDTNVIQSTDNCMTQALFDSRISRGDHNKKPRTAKTKKSLLTGGSL